MGKDNEADEVSEVNMSEPHQPSPTKESLLRSSYYANNEDAPDEILRKLIAAQFPIAKANIPTARSIINVGPLEANRSPYRPGSWVEVQGKDMKWRLDMVTHVVKLAPDDFDWNDPANEGVEPEWRFFYSVSARRKLAKEHLRAPEEGLRRVFGARPFLWQQYACVKLEAALRFHKGHTDDFMIKDIQKFVHSLWVDWLNDPQNRDFRALYDHEWIGDLGRSELLDHIMKPFQLIETIKEDETGRWDFGEDTDIGCYTYLSCLGTGYLLPIILFLIQIWLPIGLFIAVQGNCSLLAWEPLEKLGILSFKVCTNEEFNDQGYDNRRLLQSTSVVVFIFYLVRVVPDTLATFYNTFGRHSSVFSRLMSLRQNLWEQNDDTIGQMIGYKLDLYMNTAYVSLLYFLNVFVILHTESVIDVVLNSLAFEFIWQIDEGITKTTWFDPQQRWITAAAIQVVLQQTIQLNWLKNPEEFCARFCVSPDVLDTVCDGDSGVLKNKRLAEADAENVQFMTAKEKLGYRCRKLAEEMQNPNAIDEYTPPRVRFGVFKKDFSGFFCSESHFMFQRFLMYRTWSRWERLLYAPRVPTVEELFEVDPFGDPQILSSLDEIKPTKETLFANFDPRYLDKTDAEIFLRHVLSVLSFRYMILGIFKALKKRKYVSFVFRLYDGFVQWCAYVITLLFPLLMIGAVAALIQSFTQDTSTR